MAVDGGSQCTSEGDGQVTEVNMHQLRMNP